MTQATPGTPRDPLQGSPTYYEILGLHPSASVQEIRRAYRDLSKLYHPDTTELASAIATPRFQALNEAYATLSSPDKRLTYDYKIGYSRLSVMAVPASRSGSDSASGGFTSSHAYLDPTDRPLSAGELFALFLLGVTFIGCLLLVVTISLTRGDLATAQIDALLKHDSSAPPGISLNQPAEPIVPKAFPKPALPSAQKPAEFPQAPWLVRRSAP